MQQLCCRRSASAFIGRNTDQITGVQLVKDQFLGVAGADRWPQVIGRVDREIALRSRNRLRDAAALMADDKRPYAGSMNGL